MEKLYRYYCAFRPPMPGAVPKSGLVAVHDEMEEVDGRPVWGHVDYNRPLIVKELQDYELLTAYNGAHKVGDTVKIGGDKYKVLVVYTDAGENKLTLKSAYYPPIDLYEREL